MEVVKDYYSKLGYIIEIVDNGPEFEGDREHYQVTVKGKKRLVKNFTSRVFLTFRDFYNIIII